MVVRLAVAPISWGVCEVPGWGHQVDRGRVLADAVRLRLPDIEAGPPGFLPLDAREARALATRHGVRVIGGFVTVVLHRPERLDAELASLATQAAWLANMPSRQAPANVDASRLSASTPSSFGASTSPVRYCTFK